MAEAETPGTVLLKLLSAWNEADPGTRETILDEALAASFLYEDPHAPAPFEGAEGMAQYLTIFRENLPDAVLLPTGSPQVTHGTAKIRARLNRGDAPFAELTFVGTNGPDGLTRVTGFVESE
ncbi:MAG: nuclear transport factor 2 family protein [Pseudomonadota bacterium]